MSSFALTSHSVIDFIGVLNVTFPYPGCIGFDIIILNITNRHNKHSMGGISVGPIMG